MIKLVTPYNNDRQAHNVTFGLSEDNLLRIPKDPIIIKGTDIKLPNLTFIIIHGIDKDNIERKIEQIIRASHSCHGDPPNQPTRIQCLHIKSQFYISPLKVTNGLIIIIALDNNSIKLLRNRKIFQCRMRSISTEIPSIELFIFWGPTEEMMEERISKLYKIKPDQPFNTNPETATE